MSREPEQRGLAWYREAFRDLDRPLPRPTPPPASEGRRRTRQEVAREGIAVPHAEEHVRRAIRRAGVVAHRVDAVGGVVHVWDEVVRVGRRALAPDRVGIEGLERVRARSDLDDATLWGYFASLGPSGVAAAAVVREQLFDNGALEQDLVERIRDGRLRRW